MKKKVVLKVHMCCDKCRTKAKKIAVVADGVISVAIEGNDKDLVVVTGESMDPVCLVALMRKKVGCTELVSVEEGMEGNKDLVVVTGESMDPVCLVALMRKKVGCTELVSVEEGMEGYKEGMDGN